MKEVIELTQKDIYTSEVLQKLVNNELKDYQACKLLKLSQRQIYRKKKEFLINGICSVPHKNRNAKSNRSYPDELKFKILHLYKNEYLNWNFRHFNDTLEDFHNIKVSDTFIYNLLTKNNFNSPNSLKKKNRKSHPPRPRRENAGELIQVDASKHKWFHGDELYYHLHGAIDDATGNITGAFFQKEETIFGYQIILKQTIKGYGLPECLYSDYRTVFQSTKQSLTINEQLNGVEINKTKFSTMLDNLGIDIISTTNPMAKGRIERLWKTFQDRLYNELKKKKITNIEEANIFLKSFIPRYNKRFALPIDNKHCSFIIMDNNFDFNHKLATFEEYCIHQNCYLSYKNKYLVILDKGKSAYINTKNKVKVFSFLDGTINVLFNDVFYKTKEVAFIPHQVTIQKSKSQSEINLSKAHTPANNHPWKSSIKKSRVSST